MGAVAKLEAEGHLAAPALRSRFNAYSVEAELHKLRLASAAVAPPAASDKGKSGRRKGPPRTNTLLKRAACAEAQALIDESSAKGEADLALLAVHSGSARQPGSRS